MNIVMVMAVLFFWVELLFGVFGGVRGTGAGRRHVRVRSYYEI